MPLLPSYLVENSHVRDKPVPGPDVNFQGIAQVGNDKLQGQERGRAESEKSPGESLPSVGDEGEGGVDSGPPLRMHGQTCLPLELHLLPSPLCPFHSPSFCPSNRPSFFLPQDLGTSWSLCLNHLTAGSL